MTKLSVVIITFNEERNIERCINSVKDIADDIVVVDSFSTDKTCEIAIINGARVINHSFEGHIEQKNFAITQAQFPFVLSLDADEALSETLKNSILRVKLEKLYDGYKMHRLTNYCGKWIHHCGWYPDTKLRLWDSGLGKWEGINPHDKYVLKKGTSESLLEGDLFHYSYYSLSQHKQQAKKFASISAEALTNMNIFILIFKLIFSSIISFLRIYFFRLGFLDGQAGFHIARISSTASFCKYLLIFKTSIAKR